MIEHISGETETIALPEGCEEDSDGGKAKLRSTIKNLTDMTSSKESKTFRSVDIALPIPFLKVIFSICVTTKTLYSDFIGGFLIN